MDFFKISRCLKGLKNSNSGNVFYKNTSKKNFYLPARSKYVFISNSNLNKHNKNNLMNPYIIKTNILFGIFGGFGIFISKIFKMENEEAVNQVKQFLNSVLTSSEIKEGGIEFLDYVFKNQKSKEHAIKHFKNILKDEFVKEKSKKFGVNLFNQVLKDDLVKNHCKEIFKSLLRTNEVKNEGVNLAKQILVQKESLKNMSLYFRIIFKRPDIENAISNVISDSAIHTMQKDEIKEKCKNTFLEVWADPSLRWYVIKKAFNIWESTGQHVIIRTEKH